MSESTSAGLYAPTQRQELTPETGEAGETERGDRRVRQQPASHGMISAHAAEPRDLARVEALVDRAGQEEEHAGDQSVDDHRHDRAVDAALGQRRDAEHHEAHVSHGRERDETFHVRLRETRQRRVDDRDHREDADERGPDVPRRPEGSAARCGRSAYVPIFRRMAARITEPTVGASVCASGSHVWNGHIGTLIAKPRNSPAKTRCPNSGDQAPA